MLKLLKATGIAVFFIFALLSLNFLQAQEQITITTYYPSPYGAYNELQTNKLAVGDTSDDDQLSSADQPPANGQIYTARSVIYKPQSSFPESDVMQGELVYKSSGSDNSLYLRVGSEWVKQGGGMSYTKYCFDDAAYGSYFLCGTVVLGTQWQCYAGFTVEKSLGLWGYCFSGCLTDGYHNDSCGGNYFLPPGGSCGTDSISSAFIGRAYVCSQ